MWMLSFVARILLRKNAVKLLKEKYLQDIFQIVWVSAIISARSSEICRIWAKIWGFDMEKDIYVQK